MSFRNICASRASRQPQSFVLPTKTKVTDGVPLNSGFRDAETVEASLKHEGERDPDMKGKHVPQINETSETARQTILPSNAVESAAEMQTDLAAVVHQSDSGIVNTSSPVLQPSGWYAEMPPILSIKKSKKQGRGLWSKVNIPAGTIVFSVKPHAHVLSRSQLELYCTSCCAYQPPSGLKKCARCKTMHYCSTTCQNADWPNHKQECEALLKWAKSAPIGSEGEKYIVAPEAVRCLARIIWRRRKLGSSSIWWKEINVMQSHRGEVSQSMVDSQIHLAHALVRFMGIEGEEGLEKYEVRGIRELVDLISKFTSNSFTLTTPSLSPIGVSVSPLAALINHSCDPNIAVVFPRTSSSAFQQPICQVVAIQDIPVDTELYTSYVDITLPTAQRQKDLQDAYNFVCTCSVCSLAEGEEDWRACLWCPKECGGVSPMPIEDDDVVRCSKCQTIVTDTGKVIDALRVGQEALDKATSLQFTDPEEALKLTRNIISLLTGARFPRSAHPLLALQRLHQSLLIATLPTSPSEEQLDETIRAAATSVAGLSAVLRPGHPVRALALAELGKLLAVDEPGAALSSSSTSDAQAASEPGDVLLPSTVSIANGSGAASENRYPPTGAARLQLAIQTLQQAHAELRVGFGGEGGEVGLAVRELLVRLENELGVWRVGIRDALKDALAGRNDVESGATLLEA